MQVVRGEVTPEELAALYVVLAAKANAGEGPPPPPAVRPWSDPGLRLGAVRDWRSSGLPR